jgi:hypothetical protein
LIAGLSTGSFSTDGGTVSKTTYIAEAAHTFEMTDTDGDGICWHNGVGEYMVTLNDEPGAISSSRESRDFEMSFGSQAQHWPTVDCLLDIVHDKYSYETS